MKRLLLVAAAALTVLTGLMPGTTRADQNQREVVAMTPERMRWFTPPYYRDGRQRAQLLGDSSRGGAWVDRVKIPAGGRVRAHSHPHDELVTVIEGTWYLGEGERFDGPAEGLPAGQFHRHPCRPPPFRGGEGERRDSSAQRHRQVRH